MNFRKSKMSTPLVLMLTFALGCVWLVGTCAALASTLYAVQHSCCETQRVSDSCSTLCAAASSDVTVASDQRTLGPVVLVVSIVATPVARATAVTIAVPARSHAPPLYVQHASFLI